MKNALKVTALSLLVVATLAGCFKAKIDVTINEDETINGTMVMAIQAGIGESLGSSDDEILGQLTEGLGGDLEGATVEDYTEEGYIGKVFTFADQPLDFFSDGADGSEISITHEGNLFIVDGAWDTEDAGTDGMDPASLGAEFTFAVTFPGEVTDHNGTLSDDGRTVTWNLLDAPDTLHAEGKDSASSSIALWVFLALIALLIVAAVIITATVVRKRNAAPAALPEAAAPAEFAAEAPAEVVAEVADEAPAEVADEAPAEDPDAR